MIQRRGGSSRKEKSLTLADVSEVSLVRQRLALVMLIHSYRWRIRYQMVGVESWTLHENRELVAINGVCGSNGGQDSIGIYECCGGGVIVTMIGYEHARYGP